MTADTPAWRTPIEARLNHWARSLAALGVLVLLNANAVPTSGPSLPGALGMGLGVVAAAALDLLPALPDRTDGPAPILA